MIASCRMVLLLVCAFALPGVALAQSDKIYRVGLVAVGPADSGILAPGMVGNFTKRGYVVDKNIVFERRAAQGKMDRLPGLIDELVAAHVDVIITTGAIPRRFAAKERAGHDPGRRDPVGRPGRHASGRRASRIPAATSPESPEIADRAVGQAPGAAQGGAAERAQRRGVVERRRSGHDLALSGGFEVKRPNGLGIVIVPLGVHAPDDFDTAFAGNEQDAARCDHDGDRRVDPPQPQAGHRVCRRAPSARHLRVRFPGS